MIPITTIFYIIAGPVIYEHSPVFLSIYSCVAVCTLTLLLCTCCTDAGHIPRRPILDLLPKEKIPKYLINDEVTYKKGDKEKII